MTALRGRCEALVMGLGWGIAVVASAIGAVVKVAVRPLAELLVGEPEAEGAALGCGVLAAYGVVCALSATAGWCAVDLAEILVEVSEQIQEWRANAQ